MEEWINLTLRPTQQIMELFLQGKRYQPSVSRKDFFTEAVSYAISCSVPPDWKRLSDMRIDIVAAAAVKRPEFVQLRVNREHWETLTQSIKNAFAADQARIYIPYAVKLILLHYILHLSQLQNDMNDTTQNLSNEIGINLPELAAIFTRMILTDKGAAEIKQIAGILYKWQQKNNDFSH